jgi:transposase-like protein
MVTKSVPYNFRCPNLVCKAEYVAVRRDSAPPQKPRCVECGMAFLAKDEGQFIRYEAAWPVTLVPSDYPLLG